jgi:hypothetical protein
MSMQQQQWSANALSIEFGLDRRTVAQRLQNVRSVSERRVGKWIEKRWLLKDVLPHLKGDTDTEDSD